MHLPEAVSNALITAAITAAISGVLVFSFQQWVQNRRKRTEADIQHERSYQQGTHDRLAGSYAKIWTELVALEEWLKREPSKIVASGDINQSKFAPVSQAYNRFQAEILFLPNSLREQTDQLMTTLVGNINRLFDLLRTVASHPRTDVSDQENLVLINEALSKIVNDYVSTLEVLRVQYQSNSRDLLLGDLRPGAVWADARLDQQGGRSYLQRIAKRIRPRG